MSGAALFLEAFMIAIFVIFACFFGLSFLVATIMTGVMFAVGRWTLPHSPERRVREAEAQLRVAELREATLSSELRTDAMVAGRYQVAIEEAKHE
jgi:hypothetical protein